MDRLLLDEVREIATAELPVDEKISIKKHRIAPLNEKGDAKRISIITGVHGDELEGQFVCYELTNRIMQQPEALKGIVDIYPAMNPMGIDSITRGIPAFDLDMNRIFPGNLNGDMNEYLAAQIIKDIEGTDVCFDIHASNIFLTEIPQIRINELHQETLVPIASKANMDFIWVHGNSTVLESTLAYSLNSIGVNTLVVEMGVGMRITWEYGRQLTDGILSVMREEGIWDGKVSDVKTPVISHDQAGTDIFYEIANELPIFLEEQGFNAVESPSEGRRSTEQICEELRVFYRDYIENPSPYGYQSIHINFYDNSSRSFIEVQLRTKEMDDFAEIGPANHLGYEKRQEKERRKREEIPVGENRFFDAAYERGMLLQTLDLSKIRVNMFGAMDNQLINDGCGLFRGRLITPFEHLSRFQNDLVD